MIFKSDFEPLSRSGGKIYSFINKEVNGRNPFCTVLMLSKITNLPTTTKQKFKSTLKHHAWMSEVAGINSSICVKRGHHDARGSLPAGLLCPRSAVV